MSFENLPEYPMPEKISFFSTEGDTRVPYERVKDYSDKEFELFIREWVVSLKDTCQVRGFGGAGDKGRDIVARTSSGQYIYYQCKHYDHPLTIKDVLPEFGKLVYYTFLNQVPLPSAYYIVAPMDIGSRLNDLIDHPAEINKRVIDSWDDICKQKISKKAMSLNEELKEYINDFDFSIVKTKTMLEIIEEHKSTAFYAFRFGGGLTVTRDRCINLPDKIVENEMTYVKKFLDAISEKELSCINSVIELEQNYPKYIQNLRVQRERFYSAENLKKYTQKYLLTDSYYKDLMNDIYYGIYDLFIKDYDNGFSRLGDVMNHVVQIDLKHNLLCKYDLVHPQDRQGICHQLANERSDIVWANMV